MTRFLIGNNRSLTDTELQQAIGRTQTSVEDITLIVDTGSGVDDGEVITTQAQATAHGPYASLAGALTALPRGVAQNNKFTISVPAGTHIVSAIDLRKFHGFVEIVGAALTQVTGFTGTHNVASSSAPDLFVLSAPPAGADDALKRKFVNVVSGTGSGQLFPIRTHTGTSFELAGDLGTQLDATSVVEFLEASTIIDIQNAGDRAPILGPGWNGNPFINIDSGLLTRSGIDFQQVRLISTVGFAGGNHFVLREATARMYRCEVEGVIETYQSMCRLLEASSLAPSGNPLLLNPFTTIETRNSYVEGGAFSVTMFHDGLLRLDNSSLDVTTSDGIETFDPGSYIILANKIKGGGTGSAVDVRNGTYLLCDAAALDAQTDKFGPNDGDIQIDGVTVDWNDLNTAPDKIIIGSRGAYANGNGL